MHNQQCQYCGKDTYDVDIDYLSGVDHLSCALNAEMQVKNQTDEYEDCILCGDKTTILRSAHVDYRTGYIEGAGQLCIKCWNRGTDRRHMTVPMSMVYDTPNDQELGAKVRQLYHENNS